MPRLPGVYRTQRGLRSDDVQELQAHVLLVLPAEPGRKFHVETLSPVASLRSVPVHQPGSYRLSFQSIEQFCPAKEFIFLSETS